MTDTWLPPGVFELGARLAAPIVNAFGTDVVGNVERWIALPERVVVDPTRPSEPVQWQGGALCVDLGPDDAQTWETFRAVAADDPDHESVARRAQVWRLAVTPYRSVDPGGLADPAGPAGLYDDPSGVDLGDLRGAHIVDMTTMWAGPLCTELLARGGASVTKIEPMARPDGLRFGDGDDGSGCAPMFSELNRSKEIVALDLRHSGDRAIFDGLLRSADLVVTSMSSRAVTNLGIDGPALRERFPQVRTLQITAFANGSDEADWVAYGSGVHAVSGLGMLHGSPQVPAFSYPDPLAGLLACQVAIRQLAVSGEQDQRISLSEAVMPLWEWQR